MSSHQPTSGGDGEHGDAQSAALLERFGTTLRSAAVWEDPPDDLGERIVAEVSALRSGDGRPSDVPVGTAAAPILLDDGRRRRSRPGWLWPGLAAAAAAVVAFTAGVLVTGGDDNDQRAVEPIADVELTASELGGGASAGGTIVDAGAGYAISIDVAGLPPAPEGEYYEGWLHDEDTGDWVSVGTFHMRGGDDRVVLWSGVPIARYQQLVVTAEVEGTTQEHGDVLLTGLLERR